MLILAFSREQANAQPARLSLRLATDREQVQLGDTLEIQIFVEPRGAALTSVSAYVSFAEDIFTLLPEETLADGAILPFRSGDFMVGQIYSNSTSGDTIGGRDGNGLDGFQLDYIAVSGTNLLGSRSVSTEPGVLAAFKVVLSGYPRSRTAHIELDNAGRRRSIYTEAGKPGVEVNFQSPMVPLTLGVTGEGIRRLQDLQVAPGAVLQLDLRRYYFGERWRPEQIRWEFSPPGNGRIQLAMADQILSLSAAADFRVAERFEYLAVAPDGTTYRGSFSVAAGDLPAFLVPRELTLDEDVGAVAFPLRAFLAEGVPLENMVWSVVGGTTVEPDLVDGELILRVPPDWSGREEIELTVVDGQGRSDTVVISVRVLPVNDPPVVAEVKRQLVAVGGTIRGPALEDLVRDVDDPRERLRVTIVAQGEVQVEQRGGYLWLLGTRAGTGQVVVTVVDEAGGRAVGRIEVEVVSLAGPPVMAALPRVELERGDAIEIKLNQFVTDGDTPLDQLRWSILARGPLIAELTAAEEPTLRILAVTSGSGQVAVQVSDPDGNSASGALVVEVAAIKALATDSTLVRGVTPHTYESQPVVYPNPFNAEVTIEYALAEDSWAQLVIYDLQGRRVRTLIDNSQTAGEHTVVWRGHGENGRPLPSATYFFQMRTGRQRWSGKMLLVR